MNLLRDSARMLVLTVFTVGCCVLLWSCASPSGQPGSRSSAAGAGPKKIYAHYMGCYPVADGATAWHRSQDAHKLRHDGKGPVDAYGGSWRNWPLVPDGMRVSPEVSADMEIRRALRGGIDGFAIDAWAGGEGAKKVLDTLFKVAESNDYPFEITICIDPSCLAGEDKITAAAEAVKYVLDKHGASPKLARRNGKPMIFGYNTIFVTLGYAMKMLGDSPKYKGRKDLWKDPEFRTDPEVWKALGEGFKEVERLVGQPVYFHACMGAMDWMVPRERWTTNMPVQAAGILATNFGAVGSFLGGGPDYDRMAAVVKAAGAEWSEPMFFQYENLGWGGVRAGNGLDILRDRWQRARDNGSTLMQFITWNDYTENTSLSPGYETRYTILDLNAYFVQWWKTGKPPKPDHDRLYFIYHKYPKGPDTFPFKARHPAGGVLEVLTILPKPAHIRLPGRDAEFDAPAGLSWQQFEAKPGPVVAELLRGGKLVLRLESPEPITDKPFRPQDSMTCYSTEFMRHWKADFGDTAPLIRGEYGDDDQDGLPNWWEMYWYGKFMDWSTAMAADPSAVARDGKTNLQHYQDRTAPCDPPAIQK